MNILDALTVLGDITCTMTHYYDMTTEQLEGGKFDGGKSQILREHLDAIYKFRDSVGEMIYTLNDDGLPGECDLDELVEYVMDELVEFDSDRAQKICDFMEMHSNTLGAKLEEAILRA